MNAKEIKVLMVEPGQHPKVVMLKDDLDSLQKAVSIGADYQELIAFVSLGNDDCLMCNEEGKLIGLERNRILFDNGSPVLAGAHIGGIPETFREVLRRIVAQKLCYLSHSVTIFANQFLGLTNF